LSIPEAKSCYIDTVDYGRYDVYLSKYSKLEVIYTTYKYSNGVCDLEKKDVKMEPGALMGDDYC